MLLIPLSNSEIDENYIHVLEQYEFDFILLKFSSLLIGDKLLHLDLNLFLVLNSVLGYTCINERLLGFSPNNCFF